MHGEDDQFRAGIGLLQAAARLRCRSDRVILHRVAHPPGYSRTIFSERKPLSALRVSTIRRARSTSAG